MMKSIIQSGIFSNLHNVWRKSGAVLCLMIALQAFTVCGNLNKASRKDMKAIALPVQQFAEQVRDIKDISSPINGESWLHYAIRLDSNPFEKTEHIQVVLDRIKEDIKTGKSSDYQIKGFLAQANKIWMDTLWYGPKGMAE